MLKKLFLDQTKKYEQAIATYEIANMLVDFVKGRKHYLSIGAEQGDIPVWDDIVIEKEIDYYIQVQVKRQTGGFGSQLDECVRNSYKTKTKNHNEGDLRELSPLDKTIKSLADWAVTIDLTNLNPKREFWIELPELTTPIKNGLQVKHLKDLCEAQIKQSVTTSQGLKILSKQSSNIRNCYDWLVSWCDFKDWDHILKALQFLKIKNSGTEVEIENQTEQKLKDVFVADKLKDVRLKILSYIGDNTTFTGAISPRNLLFNLKDYLHHDIATWTQYEKNNLQWNITGINDLEYNTDIERPLSVVPKLWSNSSKRSLIINAPILEGCKLSEGLMRLAVHQDGLTSTHITSKNDWKQAIKAKVGGTLGIGTDDFDKLTFIENKEQFTSVDCKLLTTINEQEKIADELNENMLIVAWALLKKGVDAKLLSMNTDKSTELRDIVDLRWKDWKQKLDNSPAEQKELLTSMLNPNAEGDDIIGYMRVGLKTVTLLIDGLFFLLIISVCLDMDGTGNWKRLSNGLTLNTICLQYWSGLAGNKKVKKITEDCHKLIGKEKTDLLIMSSVEASPSEILELTLIESQENKNTLANGKQLKLLVTHNIRLSQLIDKGEVQPLRTYTESLIEKNKEAIQEAINNVIS